MPTTPAGKVIASRNAVTHGLHSQDVVLPHLGESQEKFDALRDGLARELSPRTSVQQHYVTQIAQAMWRLRRLTRWETGLYDNPALTDEERIGKMARVLRHDAALRRQVDRALKALAHPPQNCQNEPAPDLLRLPIIGAGGPPLPEGEVARLAEREGSPRPPADPHNRDAGEPGGARNEPSKGVGISALRKARKLKLREKCQNEPGIARTAQITATAGNHAEGREL